MPQSLCAVYVHVVFSTKGRRPFLRDAVVRRALLAYLGGISSRLGCAPIVVGGVEDHVHILCHLGRTVTLAGLVKELKRVSNQWLKERGDGYTDFGWQGGYATFSVSQSRLEAVRRYIANQEAHHLRVGFQDEVRLLLQRHNMTWNEEHVWD